MDRTLGDTFYLLFTTRSFSTGAPATLSGTPVVSAYPDGSTTQLTAGITLGVDHDSVTGLNLLTIVATSGNGYAAATDYSLVITTGTSGGVSVVGEVVGQFSLGLDASYKRLGAPAGASVSADIADVPTVSEFNARTLIAADYFDPATDTVATVTNLTNLPAITANWLTAAGIAAGALDGKGNWNIGKTGYTLTQTFPANFSDLAVTVTTGKVAAENVTLAATTHTGAVIPTVSTLSGHTPQTADHTAAIAAIQSDTNDLQAQIGTAGAGLTDLGGMSTAMKAQVNAEALDVLATDTHIELASVPPATSSIKDKITWLFMLARNKIEQTSTTTTLRADDTTTSVATSTVSDDGTTATRGEMT